jgi:putative ATPase
MRVFVLEPLRALTLARLVDRALADVERGLGGRGLAITDDARTVLATESDGDARRALTVLDAAALLAGGTGEITREIVVAALQQRVAHYDKSGEQHFNLISAYHKALRGSDPQGALYWLARMIEGGEDPLYLARRTVRFASEDIGLADPRALEICIAARDAYHFLGSPVGELALAVAALYCATAPKSNRVYLAWKAAQAAARETPAAPVPLHIRNAPTALMKELGYGAGYQNAHNAPGGYIPQDNLPEEVRERTFYEPGSIGFEKEEAKRLAWWQSLRDRKGAPNADDAGPEASL